MTCWNSYCADAEAERIGRADADEEALEQRRREIEDEARDDMLAALADGSGDLGAAVAALDEALSDPIDPLMLIDALRGNCAALARWAAAAIDRAAKAQAEGYTLEDLQADALAAEAL